MTTKATKAAKACQKTTTLHIPTPGSGKPNCGASGKGMKSDNYWRQKGASSRPEVGRPGARRGGRRLSHQPGGASLVRTRARGRRRPPVRSNYRAVDGPSCMGYTEALLKWIERLQCRQARIAAN